MQRSFTFVCLLVVCFICLGPLAAQESPTPEPVGLRPDAPEYALHGPYWVGTQEFEAETTSHPTYVRVWYPALNPDQRLEAITYSETNGATAAGHAILNAAPDPTDGPYPLVIFSHGNGASRHESIYLAEHLASQGFAVMALSHDDAEEYGPSDYTRPQDITWLIDFAESLVSTEGQPFYQVIDAEHIAVTGHSFGADTALMAGGGRLDYGSPASPCRQYPDMPLTILMEPWLLSELCAEQSQSLADYLHVDVPDDGLWPSWSDPRVDAIVALAPDLILFGPDSFTQVTVPTMIIVGSDDQSVKSFLPEYQPYLYDNLPSTAKAFVQLAGADHMVFAIDCDAAPWLVDFGFFWACSDPVWDMDRAHDLINHFTTAFLLSTLKGDAEATAALAPDVVSFPGIEYQAEGF